MPRTISPELEDHFSGSSLSIATCVLITRKDGMQIGMTSHDMPFTFDDILYSPEASMETSSIRSSADSGVDSSQVLGYLSSDRISDLDLLGGRFDYADVQLFQVNYNDLSMGRMLLLRAKLGEITLTDGAFRAELRSLSAQLKMYIGDVSSPTCRVQRLGDAQCKVDISLFTVSGTVASGANTRYQILSSVAATKSNGYFNSGVARLTSGTMSGMEREIKSHVGNTLVLKQPFPLTPTAGDALSIEAGCDRTYTTCRTQFNNTKNFHGEPHLPGNIRLAEAGRPPSG